MLQRVVLGRISRGFVRAGATGVIAPVDFQKTPFVPVEFLKTFRKEENFTVFDWSRVIRK